MALSQSVASKLLEAFRAREGVDLVRESARLVMQELIDVDAAEQIGAGRYERTDTRTTQRNGSRPRLVATQAGDVGAVDPKSCGRGRSSRSSWNAADASTKPCKRWWWRPMSTGPRPGRSMTWSPRSASGRASSSQRCRGSAPAWTSRSPRSAAGRCTTPRSPTCSYPPPICMSAAVARSPAWRWWSPRPAAGRTPHCRPCRPARRSVVRCVAGPDVSSVRASRGCGRARLEPGAAGRSG